jgi:YVTN family beta-propeller protein
MTDPIVRARRGAGARSVRRAALLVALAAPVAAAQGKGSGGTLVVLNKAEATASLVSLPEGTIRATVPTGEGPHEVAVSPDGRWGVVADYGSDLARSTLTVMDIPAGRAARTVSIAPHSWPHGVAWVGRAVLVAVTSERDSTVLVVDVERGAIVERHRTGQGVSHMVAATADGRRLYVANIGSGSATMIDRATGAVRSVRTGGGAEGIALTPDGRELWVTNRAGNTVSVLDARTMAPLATLPSADFPIRVKITPDGKRALVSNAQSAVVRVFDVPSRRELAAIAMEGGAAGRGTILGERFRGAVPIGILIAPDGARAYVAGSSADAVAVIDLATLAIERWIAVGREPDGLGYAPPSSPR